MNSRVRVERVEEELLLIPGDSVMPTLALHHRPPVERAVAGAGRVVLYIHGATFPAALAVGFRFDGYSWMDDLATAGFDVWALDFVGFGASSRYPELAAPADAHAPLGRVPEASAQIARAVDFITARQGVRRVSLIAHSWGTLAAGRFATEAPARVDRLVLFGPITRREDRPVPGRLPAWRDITLAAQWARFTEDVPAGEPPLLRGRHFEAWGLAYLTTDPGSMTRTPPSVRTPGGPMADILAAWSGEFPYDPAAIVAPTLIARGEWDSLSTDADARWLFDALRVAPVKRDVKIGRATHLMHLEENRFQLYREVGCFLSGSDESHAAIAVPPDAD